MVVALNVEKNLPYLVEIRRFLFEHQRGCFRVARMVASILALSSHAAGPDKYYMRRAYGSYGAYGYAGYGYGGYGYRHTHALATERPGLRFPSALFPVFPPPIRAISPPRTARER